VTTDLPFRLATQADFPDIVRPRDAVRWMLAQGINGQ
jgi:hypothetical protein